MTEIKTVRFLFGWCKRKEHDQCKGEKKVGAGFHYICSCKHHKNGGPDKVAA